jgi:outer membrane protein
LKTNPNTAKSLQIRLGVFGIAAICAVGCNHSRNPFDTASVGQQTFPLANESRPSELPPPGKVTEATAGKSQAAVPTQSPATSPIQLASVNQPVAEASGPPAELPEPSATSAIGCDVGQTLALPDAIAMAFRMQPRLRASLESIRQAQGREDIAFAAYLPTVSAAYSVGGYDLRVGGTGLPLPNSPPFTFIPSAGAIPIGLDIQTGYELAELKLQWLICDFGRRSGLSNQAGLGEDIARLQTERAYQTVATDVSTAYYQVLRVQDLHRIAEESVRRAETDRNDAQKLAKGGVIENEKVLRAEVAVAQAQRLLDVAEEEKAVAVAALNLAIGLNIGLPTGVIETSDVPPFTTSLAECLQSAVASRREFQVAHRSVQVAAEGARIAEADFAPRIIGGGYLNNFQQSSPRADADLAVGFIRLEWGLFEGGKRIAELRVNDSRVREAMAESESIANTIAFQVNQAYHQMVAARKGIDRSRPAVEQTRETYRLVTARSVQGDATPAELTDAEVALTRAQQDSSNAIYDYLIAIARLEYTMGTAPVPR